MEDIKITSYNTLFYKYSEGFSSFHTQLNEVRNVIEAENPDVCILLEMPNPYEEITDKNILLHQALETLHHWFLSKDYRYTKKLNDMLSVWVVSRFPLIPLLLCGSSSLTQGITNLFSKLIPEGGTVPRISGSSTFFECLQQMTQRDRSVIVGVVLPNRGPKEDVETVRHVLPLVATHARCLYYNTRFGRLLSHFCRAFTASAGVIVGDMNIEPPTAAQVDGEDFKREVPEAVRNAILSFPLGSVSSSSTPTAISTDFPFEPLNLDYFFTPKPVPVDVGKVSTLIPSAAHCSDHCWVSARVPTQFAIPAKVRKGTNEIDIVEPREVSYLWGQSYKSVLACHARRMWFPAPTPPSPVPAPAQ